MKHRTDSVFDITKVMSLEEASRVYVNGEVKAIRLLPDGSVKVWLSESSGPVQLRLGDTL